MIDPQPGDLIAIHTRMFFSRLIQGAQWLHWRKKGEWRYNHAAVYIGDGQIVEANPAGVQIMPLSEYPEKDYIVIPVQGDRNLAVEKAKSLVGTPYGWIDIIAFVFYILGVDGKKIDAINRRVSTLVCSQVSALAAEAAGDTRFPDPYLTVPAEIAAAYT